MDYEAEDKYMSSWVVTCVKKSTRFFINDDLLATDVLSRAKVYRWPDKAEAAADLFNVDPGWTSCGFRWLPMRVADAMAREQK